MKFANIKYTKRNKRLTVGDDMQLLAIENLYREMGIDYKDVIRIELNELASYDGEYVILPISFPLIAYYNAPYVTMFSHKIIPVFLGLCTLTPKFQPEEVDYLRRFAPIGCRDEYTFRNMLNQGIPAYLNGCMTLTFPKVKKNLEQCNKVYCIDVPDNLRNYIPEKFREDCIYISHTFYVSELEGTPEEQAKKLYGEYIEHARLVITTRMHAALPCIAAGIPVILMKDQFSYRFAGIDKIVKVYTKEEYKNIDWNPEPLQFEVHKTKMLEVAKERVWDAYYKYAKVCDLSAIMEAREKREEYIEFIDNTIEYIRNTWNPTKEIRYILWGVTQTAEVIHYYISENYPCAKLEGVIDKSKKIRFLGVETKPKEELSPSSDIYYLVCTGAAIQDSNNYFEKNGISKFYQCCDDGVKHIQDLVEAEETPC